MAIPRGTWVGGSFRGFGPEAPVGLYSLKSALQSTDSRNSTRERPCRLSPRKGEKCRRSRGFIVLFFRGFFGCKRLLGEWLWLERGQRKYHYHCDETGEFVSD
jgi:hypothetical protein